jgi:hypothetical protein
MEGAADIRTFAHPLYDDTLSKTQGVKQKPCNIKNNTGIRKKVLLA